MYLNIATWVIFMALSSVGILIYLWRYSFHLPIKQSVTLWAIAFGQVSALVARGLDYAMVGFWALLLAACIIVIHACHCAYVSMFRDSLDQDMINAAHFEAWLKELDRQDAYSLRIQSKSPKYLRRALLIVVDPQLRHVINQRLDEYRSRQCIRRVA